MNKFISKITFSFILICLSFLTLQAQESEKSATSLYNEGLALLKEKDYTNGLPLMESAIEKATTEENEKVLELAKKNGAIAAYNVGRNAEKSGSEADAEKYYLKGIDLNPSYSSNYSALAGIYRDQDKTDLAVENYIKAIKVAKENEKVKKVDNNLKRLTTIVGKEYTSKNYDKAIEYGNAVNNEVPIHAIHYYVSRSYIEKADFKMALENAENAIKVGTEENENEDKYYVALALAHAGLGNKTEAIKAYEMVTDETYKEQAQYQISLLKE